AAELRQERQHAAPLNGRLAHEEDVDVRAIVVALADGEQQALEARAEADSGGRRAADLLDEPVVAAAAADRVLRADRLVLELEGRARVVVEPAHERRHELVADAERVEVLAHPREMFSALVAERVADLRRLREHRL